MNWTVEYLNLKAEAEVEALPRDMRARFYRLVKLIEESGLEALREPYAKHLEGPLWELRMKGRDGISRAIYVTASVRRVVVVRAFVKKTQQTPRHEIDLAIERVKKAGIK